jgi:hypothetical protein
VFLFCCPFILFVTRLCRFHTNKNITEGKKTLLAPLFLFAFAIAHRCCSCALAVTMGSSSTSSGPVPVLRCLLLFNGTNYHDWVPRMHLHMCELRLWEFLTSELPCPPPPSAPAQPVISEKTTTAEKKRLITVYDDRLASYES